MALQLVRTLWGAALLAAPRRALQRGGDSSERLAAVTRLLGLRYLAEAAVLFRSRRRSPPRWPVAIDLLHATSMLAVAWCSRRVRREALTSALIASLLAAWAEVERRRG